MPLSRAQAAKRALIAALKSLARAYGVPLSLSRDADDAAVRAAHPAKSDYQVLGPLRDRRHEA